VGIYENDVATLLHDYQPNVSVLLMELSKYVNETDLAEIKNIIADIRIALTFQKRVSLINQAANCGRRGGRLPHRPSRLS